MTPRRRAYFRAGAPVLSHLRVVDKMEPRGRAESPTRAGGNGEHAQALAGVHVVQTSMYSCLYPSKEFLAFSFPENDNTQTVLVEDYWTMCCPIARSRVHGVLLEINQKRIRGRRKFFKRAERPLFYNICGVGFDTRDLYQTPSDPHFLVSNPTPTCASLTSNPTVDRREVERSTFIAESAAILRTMARVDALTRCAVLR